MIAAFFVAFGTVFLAELPDKTMVASLVLTTRYRRPLAVWTGVSIAFVLHVVLAVSIGSLLRQLPERPVQLVVAVLFLVGGVLYSVERILGEGACRIGADMGDTIADRAEHALTAVAEYHSLRGQTIIICFICIVSSLAYWLGSGNVLMLVPAGGPLETLLFLPAGWCVFLCGVTYTFFWIGDHWKRIKRTMLYKTFLGLQVFFLAVLASILL